MTIADVAEEVSFHMGTKVDKLRRWGRCRTQTMPRHIAMFIARRLTGESYPDIGRWFGGRHHTTVISACRKVERLWCVNGRLAGTVDGICHVLIAQHGEPLR